MIFCRSHAVRQPRIRARVSTVFAMFVVRGGWFRFALGQVLVFVEFRRVGDESDRLTAGRSRKHIVSDRMPTTTYVLRRVSWMLPVREFVCRLCTHSRAESRVSKWVLACREPTTTPPRARDPRALGMSTSALRRSASPSDQDSVRTGRPGPSGPPESPNPPRPRSQCRNTPPKQGITPLPLLLR